MSMQEYIQKPNEQYGNNKSQYPNTEEAEKYDFLKMVETLKEEMKKNPLKIWRKRQTKIGRNQ